MLEINGLIKFSEEDVYTEGCIPDSGVCHQVDVRFKAETQEELIEKLCDFLDTEYYMIDACDEKGRIDFLVMENADGRPASEDEVLVWRDGENRLWNCAYTAHVEEVQRKPAELREF